MKRNTLNFWIDVLALVVLAALTYTGLLMEWVLPPGSGRGPGGMHLWGLNRHDFGEIHLWLGIALLVLLILHLALHWTWVCCTLKTLIAPGSQPAALRRRIISGIILCIVLAGLILGGLWWAKTQVQPRRHAASTTIENK